MSSWARATSSQAVVDPVHREDESTGGDGVQDLLEGRRRQVAGIAEVAREPHAPRQVLVRGEVPHRPLVGEAAAEAARAVDADRAQGVGEGRGADEVEGGVDTVRVQLPYGGRHFAGVEQRVVDTVLLQRGEAVGAAGGGQHRGTAPAGQRGGGEAHGGGAAPDQYGLPRLQIQPDGERAVRGLHHLRQRAQHLPGQLGVHGDHLRQRHRRVLRVPAVVGPPHVPHHRDDPLPPHQPTPARRGVDGPGGLDPRHPGKADTLTHPQPQLQLRPIDPERLDPDPHPPVPLGRQRKRDQPQVLHGPGCGQLDGAHGDRRGGHGRAFFPGGGEPGRACTTCEARGFIPDSSWN